LVVKLFFLPDAKDDIETRTRYAKHALASVQNLLGVDEFDTLILSLPGIILEMDEEDYDSNEFPVSEKTIMAWMDIWKAITEIILSDIRYLNHCMNKERRRLSESRNSESFD
jgi:hypothetical protein